MPLLRNPDRLSLFADAALIGRIERVTQSIERSGEGLPTTVLTGEGQCIDAIYLAEDIRW